MSEGQSSRAGINRRLTPRQLGVLGLLVAVPVGVVAVQFVTAPQKPTRLLENSPYHNTSIGEIAIELGPLAPPRFTPGRPRSPESQRPPKPSPEQVERLEKLQAQARAYLRSENIPQGDDPRTATDTRTPLKIIITIRGNGTLIEGQPESGILEYHLTIERDAFASLRASAPIRVMVLQLPEALMHHPLGVVTPQTLEKKQEEALGRALEDLVRAWRFDNPSN